MPTAVLLNDTYNYYHWGCTATSGAIRRRLHGLGYDLASVEYGATMLFDQLPERLTDFDDPDFFRRARQAHPRVFDVLAGADVVVVNGEGSLHRVRRISMALLYLIHASKQHLGRRVHLINHSLYPEPVREFEESPAFQIYRHVVPQLDFVAVREHISHRLMQQAGLAAELSFDCLPLTLADEFRHQPRIASRKIVVAGSSAFPPEKIADLSRYLHAMHRRGYAIEVLVGASNYPAPDEARFVERLRGEPFDRWTLTEADSLERWFACLRSAAVFVSGRFHHTIAATFLGVPCVVMEANTPKNEALCETFGYEPPLSFDAPDFERQLFERTNRALARSPVDDQVLDALRLRAERNFAGLASSAESRAA